MILNWQSAYFYVENRRIYSDSVGKKTLIFSFGLSIFINNITQMAYSKRM